MDNVNYLGIPYRNIPVSTHIRNKVRTYLKSGGFYCLLVGSEYKHALSLFLENHFNYADKNKIPLFPLPIMLHNDELQKDILDQSFILLFSNNLINKEQMLYKLQNYIRQGCNQDYIFEKFDLSTLKQPPLQVKNELFSSFDEGEAEFDKNSSSAKFYQPTLFFKYEELEIEDLNNVIPIFNECYNLKYLYMGMQRWCSQIEEIREVVAKSMN